MSAEQPQPRGLLMTSLGLALAVACSSVASSPYKDYEAWHDVMEHEMSPVLGAFTDQLSKDPENTDYGYISNQSQRAAYYFSLFSDPNSHLYANDPDERASARKAQTWLLKVAAAADGKEQGPLVRLMAERKRICTLCHDDPEG